MPAPPIQYGGAALDLSPRLWKTKTVAASPSGSTETIVASLTLDSDVAVMEAILLTAFTAFTVGTNGVSVNIKIRQTDASGSTISASGAVTYTAADLGTITVYGIDTSPLSAGGVYVVTATVASGSAASTFSAVAFSALAI